MFTTEPNESNPHEGEGEDADACDIPDDLVELHEALEYKQLMEEFDS